MGNSIFKPRDGGEKVKDVVYRVFGCFGRNRKTDELVKWAIRNEDILSKEATGGMCPIQKKLDQFDQKCDYLLEDYVENAMPSEAEIHDFGHETKSEYDASCKSSDKTVSQYLECTADPTLCVNDENATLSAAEIRHFGHETPSKYDASGKSSDKIVSQYSECTAEPTLCVNDENVINAEIQELGNATLSENDASCKCSDTTVSRNSECTPKSPSGYDASCECSEMTVSCYSECTPEPLSGYDASCECSETTVSGYSECTPEPPSGYDASCECSDTTVSCYSECTPEPLSGYDASCECSDTTIRHFSECTPEQTRFGDQLCKKLCETGSHVDQRQTTFTVGINHTRTRADEDNVSYEANAKKINGTKECEVGDVKTTSMKATRHKLLGRITEGLRTRKPESHKFNRARSHYNTRTAAKKTNSSNMQ